MRTVLYQSSMVWCILLMAQITVLTGCGPSLRLRPQAEERYRLAQAYLGHASYDLAEEEIRKALALVSDEPRYFELLALIYQAQGRLRPAAKAYRMALQHTDVPPSVLVNYSTLLLRLDRPGEAIAFAQRALLDPGYAKPAIAHVNIGLAYLKQGTRQQAAEHLRTALEYQPSLPEAHYNLGLVYAHMGKQTLAIRSYRAAIRVRPSYVEAYAGLGWLLLAAGRHDEARDAFERVIVLAPNSDAAVASRRQLQLLTP